MEFQSSPLLSGLETSEGTVSDVLRKRRHPRDLKIWKLARLGWTQQKVADLFGMDRTNVSYIVKSIDNNIIHIQQQFFQKKKSIEEICSFNDMDELTVWSMILDDKSDSKRFELFGKSEYQNKAPRLYNVWNFMSNDPRLGIEHPGNIPGQIAMNVLYYYTEQGDMVIDPMAGGGSTLDACFVMGRKCLAYDINPTRYEVMRHVTCGMTILITKYFLFTLPINERR